MYLHEEYIQRHGLDIPVILYRQRSTVFLRSEDAPRRWRILAFCWHEPDRHPGFWEIGYNAVVHDGHRQGRLVDEIDKIDICYSDEYEHFVWHMVNAVKADEFRAAEAAEQGLAAWQVFLVMYDSWLAKNMDAGFSKLVGETLDAARPREARQAAFEAAQRRLRADKAVNDLWSFNLSPLASAGSEWLVRLIND